MDVDLSIVKEETDNEVINGTEIKTEPVENEEEGKEEYGLCEPCKGDGVVTQAEGKCLECVECMCTTCFRHHRKAKPCRYHTLVKDTTTPFMPEENETRRNCKYHTAEKIQFYCYCHECIGCSECMALAHKGCKTEMIKVLAASFKDSERFKSLITKLSDLGEAFKEIQQKIIDSKADNEKMYEQALEKIKKFKRDIENYLYVEGKRNCSELEKLRCSNTEELENLERDSKAIVSRIERLAEKVNSNIYEGEALFINSVKCRFYIPNLEKALARIKSGKNIRKYRYVLNEDLSNVINQATHIGEFECSDKGDVNLSVQPAVREKQAVATKSRTSKDHKNDDMKRGNKRKRNETRRPSPTKATVGARVRPGPLFTYDWDHRNKPGTVTSLEPDGTVTVEWDATGKSWSGYRVGAVWNGVELI